MCGINGFIKNIDQQQSENLIKNMNQTIIHRGPDDQGFFCQSNTTITIGQGQVRLSIIDLSDAGFQPMFYNKDVGCFSQKHNPKILEEIGEKSIRIVFNGEIYNFQEIKGDLINKGYNFSSNSDTEVILASYLEYGADCINYFNGMRAFAIYDPNKQELFCSRDRLGKKPFYYYCDGDQFIFSSELKGILEHKELKINIKENIDSEALDFYFTMGYIPAPWTIYKNVKKLEARHSLQLKVESGKLKVEKHCYYDIPEYTPTYDKQHLIEEGKKLLEETVKIRMFTSDVPVGAFLSGGLDSSSVVAEMRKRVDKENLNTFSIGFEGKYDESNYIHIVEKAFGTNHHHEYFREKDFKRMIDDISFYYDEPFADYSNFPTRFVSELAKKYVTVSLSGDGGDEIFGGYMMHQVGAQMTIIRKLPRLLRQLLYYIIPKTANNLSLLSKIKEAFRVSLLPPEQFYANIGGSTLYKPEIYKKWTEDKFKELLEATHGNFTQAMIDFDLFYNTLADNFLVKTDRASMAQPLEIRSPFLDIRWIDRGRKTPTKWKVNWRKTKILMREIIKDIVPQEIIHRSKQGFEPPIKDWILQKEYKEEIELGLDMLTKNNILSSERKYFYQHQVFKNNNSVFNVYKVKLFLLIKWYKQWVQ
ncbi:MAG: asparagine synthase (glutamine-hydrolyzing) [Candidatus Absconditabacterales bacterium]